MKDWFNGLGSRERLLLISGAAVLGVFLLYALIFSPMHTSYETLKTRVVAQRDTNSWMKQSAQLLQQLKSSRGPAAQGLGGKSLLAMADSTARSNALGPFLKRVEPEGRKNVRVWLEGASFDQMVKWLGQLSSAYGIGIDSITMERSSDTAGRVNARLTLQAPDL